MTRRQGPRCEPVKTQDGSTLLVRMKPGAELTDEDRQTLAEFHQFLKDKRAEQDAEAGDA